MTNKEFEKVLNQLAIEVSKEIEPTLESLSKREFENIGLEASFLGNKYSLNEKRIFAYARTVSKFQLRVFIKIIVKLHASGFFTK